MNKIITNANEMAKMSKDKDMQQSIKTIYLTGVLHTYNDIVSALETKCNKTITKELKIIHEAILIHNKELDNEEN